MDVCRLLIAGKLVFYGEAVPASREPAPKGWLERTWTHWYERLTHAESRISPALQRVERWLKQREAVDEAMLRSLRLCNEIRLLHGSEIEPLAVRQEWRKRLRLRRWQHAGLFLINFVPLPLAVIVLTPLPGPNVVAIWFVYRTVCHALAFLGTRHALGRQFKTTSAPSEALTNFDPSPQRLNELAHAMNWNDHARIAKILPDPA